MRAWKENAQGRTYFLYDGSHLVGEFDSSGVMQVSQTWGAEGLAYRRTASGASAGTRFYSWDTRGNVAATTDATGAVVNTPSSDGFSSSGGAEPCATFGGQVGGYRDNETGLVLFGQRYYDQGLGSWLTRDPIAENGGINLYSYVQGNPVNGVDPSGLSKNYSAMSCKELIADIYATIGTLHVRIQEQKDNKYDLFQYLGREDPTFGDRNPDHPGAGTWSTHDNEIKKSLTSLNALYHEYTNRECPKEDNKPGKGGQPGKKFPLNPGNVKHWINVKAPSMPSQKAMDRVIIQIFAAKEKTDLKAGVFNPNIGGFGLHAEASGGSYAPSGSLVPVH